ncbi:MAG: CDP-alcohol phosphatidyltransferase family protein [Dehalococcoidia bacterium]|nr:CDP-alcohol phosphatidyltransferase family protein [Dehalococcoidia bacterium]
MIARTGISPNALTIAGFLLSAVTAWVLATGHLFVGGLLVVFSAWFDMLDGALAKMIGSSTRFGAILDSTVDRLSEAALFLGLLIYYVDRHETDAIVLVYIAVAGSFMVSYIRARAEALGIQGEVGFFARPERIVLLTLGLLLTAVTSTALIVVLWILAVGTNLTALRRLLHSWQQTKEG